ncbi:MAG: hypothetical protein AAF958_04520 [Planctomycetota bacterium]
MLRRPRFATVLLRVSALSVGVLLVTAAAPAMAQRPWGGGFGGQPSGTTFKPGGYLNTGGNRFVNPATGATYYKGQAVIKSSGVYTPIGRGYYRNPYTGNVYNPTTGSYTQGKNIAFKPGGYVNTGGNRYYNPVTGSTYYRGQAVVKGSGVYTPIGGGYYRNPMTGNVYNPSTGVYKYR